MITEFSSLENLPEAARALFGQGAFSTRAWYGSIAAALPPGAQPCFQVVETAGSVDAVFPMQQMAGALSALATPYTCLWTPMTASGLSIDRLHAIGRDLAPIWRPAGVVRLEAMAAQNPAMDAVLEGLRRAGLRTLPFNHFGNWHLDASGLGWDAYLAGRPGEIRSTVRRATKRLMDASGAVFTLVQGTHGLEPAIDAYQAVYDASWKQSEPYPQFNPALMRACAADGSLRLGIITLAGAAIAAQFWLVHDRWAGVLKLAHTEAHRALAPGTVLTALMIRHLLDVDGVHELDFGRGDDAYKRLWTGARRQRVGVLVVNPLSVRGIMAIARYQTGHLRNSLARFARARGSRKRPA